MRFYTRPHKHYCGIDLHARMIYLCVLDAAGTVLLSRARLKLFTLVPIILRRAKGVIVGCYNHRVVRALDRSFA
jgi:hypothetical protein